jgi:hypothetical protein
MNEQLFEYYFMKRNGLWQERLDEYEELGGEASSIAKLIHACEIGDGIDQHASEDLKAVSSFMMVQADELARLQQKAERGDKIEQAARDVTEGWNKGGIAGAPSVIEMQRRMLKLAAALDNIQK